MSEEAKEVQDDLDDRYILTEKGEAYLLSLANKARP